MTPILCYLTLDEFPSDKNKVSCLGAKAVRFTILNGQLLKRLFYGPYLKCVTPEEANYILAKLFQGEYGKHAGGRSLTNRALTVGY